MPYITQTEAEQNVDGFIAKTQAEKDALIMKSEAYLQSSCVPAFKDVTKVPPMLKQASYEIIKGAMDGTLFVGVKQSVSEKRVKAGDVESQKKFAEGSIELNPVEQYIAMLIKPFAFCGKARMSIRERI